MVAREKSLTNPVMCHLYWNKTGTDDDDGVVM